MSFCIELFCVVTLQYQILVRIAIAYFIIEKKKAAPQSWQAIAQRFCSTGIYGAGRGEFGAKKTAMLFNQLNPKIIESSMLTIYKTSELYQEIQKGNWKEESEIEKLIELKTLVENLTINTRIVTDGASNLIQVRGNLPADKKKLIKHLEYQISNADEASLREYRVNLRHL